MCLRATASLRLLFGSFGKIKDVRRMSTSQFPATGNVEEETLPAYRQRGYYSARIGEVLDRRYQIVGKLGYGMSSTVWLCKCTGRTSRDYRVVKICTNEASNRIERGENTEVRMLQRINSIRTTHSGANGVRRLIESFTIAGRHGSKHTCLVHKPLGTSIHDLQRCIGGSLPLDLLKSMILQVLVSLDYLHNEANIVHTDLQPSNILLSLKDDAPLSDYEDAENALPNPREDSEGRIVHQTRPLPVTSATMGLPMIADFGEARDASGTYRDEIMPDLYRAPEIILDAPWDVKVDIWNLGVLACGPFISAMATKLTYRQTWSLLEGENLFVGLDSEGKLNNYYHLAEMVALLGPAPAWFVARGDLGPRYFNSDGSWREALEIPSISLEEKERQLSGEEKTQFLAFLRRILQWDPALRPSAKELIYDDFLGVAQLVQ